MEGVSPAPPFPPVARQSREQFPSASLLFLPLFRPHLASLLVLETLRLGASFLKGHEMNTFSLRFLCHPRCTFLHTLLPLFFFYFSPMRSLRHFRWARSNHLRSGFKNTIRFLGSSLFAHEWVRRTDPRGHPYSLHLLSPIKTGFK